MQSQHEMSIREVSKELVRELNALGFSFAQAAQALYHSGNASVEDAVNWIIDHENDAETDQVPVVAINIDIESPEPDHMTDEEMKMKAQQLSDQARQKKEAEEKKLERKREKERIRAGKELLGAKRTAEENERKRFLASRKKEKEEEKRARKKILEKLEADKLERGQNPSQSRAAVYSSRPVVPDATNTSPSLSFTKFDQMRECLRSLKRNHKDEDAVVKRAFQTLLIYVGNVVKNPEVEKYRRIRLSNPLFLERVGSLEGGIEFLELCGFERTEEGGFLFLPQDKVDMATLNSAGSLLKSAMTNPFFGLLSG